jgi:hypothetical protein
MKLLSDVLSMQPQLDEAIKEWQDSIALLQPDAIDEKTPLPLVTLQAPPIIDE